MVSQLVSTSKQEGQNYYPHFTDEQADPERLITSYQPQGELVVELDSSPVSGPNFHALALWLN